jgi:hypothetical protein
MENKPCPPNHLITEDKWDAINKLMKNPAFSQLRFLDPKEDARDVIAKDKEYLQKIGITTDQLADKLESIYKKARDPNSKLINGMYKYVDGLYVEFLETCGSQLCPFCDVYGINNGSGANVWIHKNLPAKPCNHQNHHCQSSEHKTCDLWFGVLLIHMIKHHGFFEGNCHFRVEPSKIIEILGLKY